MPQYQYKCPQKHFIVLSHPIKECEVVRFCPQCGEKMHRVPQSVRVNWNGLPPHLEGTRSQAVQSFLDNSDARRDNYLANKEK